MNRRQWIESVARWIFSAIIVVISSVLAQRRWRSGCLQVVSTCRDCRLLNRCELPAASGFRTQPRTKSQTPSRDTHVR
jgi:hypothetical protein